LLALEDILINFQILIAEANLLSLGELPTCTDRFIKTHLCIRSLAQESHVSLVIAVLASLALKAKEARPLVYQDYYQ